MTIDMFHSEYAGQIANLNHNAEGIRSDLAKLAAANPQPAPAQPLDALVRRFNDRVQEIETGNPLFAQP
jgi:hypothetical protein